MFYMFYEKSPVGRLLMTSDGENLTGLSMQNQRHYKDFEKAVLQKDLSVFRLVKTWLDDYWQGCRPNVDDLPLKTSGSLFQQKVWQELLKIPYGKLVTYGDIAKQVALELGKEKMSAQAVGGAVGHNSICIIIPCHRVVGSNGNLTGYDGGLDKKVILLRHEQADMTKLFLPKQNKSDYFISNL